MTRLACVLLLGAALAACQRAQAPPDGRAPVAGIEIIDGWARPVARAEGATANSAAYFTLANRATERIVLVGAHSDAATRTEIHETRIENGVMRMRPVTEVELPAGAEVRFEPGGLHVMLMGLQRDLVAGDSLELVLEFDDGTTRSSWLAVRQAPP